MLCNMGKKFWQIILEVASIYQVKLNQIHLTLLNDVLFHCSCDEWVAPTYLLTELHICNNQTQVQTLAHTPVPKYMPWTLYFNHFDS